MGRSLSFAVVVALLCVVAPPALAQAPTRAQWSEQADDLCRTIRRQNVELLEKSLRLVEQRRFTPAGRAFTKVFRRSKATFQQIRELERPDGDRKRIERWLDGEDRAFDLSIDGGRALKRGQVSRWGRLLKRAIRIDRKAQRSIRGFKPPKCTS